MNVDGEAKFKIWITGSTIWTRINRLIRSTKIYPVHFHPCAWQGEPENQKFGFPALLSQQRSYILKNKIDSFVS